MASSAQPEEGWQLVDPDAVFSEDEWEKISLKSHQFEPPEPPLPSPRKEEEKVPNAALPYYHWCTKCLSKWEAATGKQVPSSQYMKPSKHNKFFKAVICPSCFDKQCTRYIPK